MKSIIIISLSLVFALSGYSQDLRNELELAETHFSTGSGLILAGTLGNVSAYYLGDDNTNYKDRRFIVALSSGITLAGIALIFESHTHLKKARQIQLTSSGLAFRF